jgi:NADPH2:quinone reductase
LGIECVGVVEDGSDTIYQKGQSVAAVMRGMGREFDGGYAEYCCPPAKCCYPIDTKLDWATLVIRHNQI